VTISILAAAMLFQPAQSQAAQAAPQWALVASDEEGEHWLDQASLRKDGSFYRFRLRHLEGRGGSRSALVDYQLDCAGQTLAIESLETFDSAGTVVATRTVPADWLDKDRIYAGSIESRFYARVCPAAVRRQLADRPPPSVVAVTTVAPPPILASPAPPPPPPPPPPGSDRARGAQPVEPLTGLFSADDYPAAAVRNGEEGSILYRLTIDKAGRLSSCNIVTSSGSASLDSATCRIIRTRATFRPARNAKGKTMAGTILGRIIWRIPNDPLPPPPAAQ